MKISKQEKHIIDLNSDKNAWAKDIAKAFTISGIKDNYHRFNTSLKDLFDDPCDALDVNGDIVIDTSTDDNNKTSKQDDKLAQMLEESNRQTIKKRAKFDYMALGASIGIALVMWIINLIQAMKG